MAEQLPLTEAQVLARIRSENQRVMHELTANLLGLREGPIKRPSLPGPTREPEELEDELDGTTEERASTLIGNAFKDGLAYSALVLATREMFKSWSDEEDQTSRGETTALAEISGAYHDGGRDFARDYPGDVEKLWEIEDDDACEFCQANAEMDWIPDDAPFDSGDFEPPVHPNCRCSVSYRTVETD